MIKRPNSLEMFWFISSSVLIVKFTSCVQTLVVNTLMSIYSAKSLASLFSVMSQARNGKAERMHRTFTNMAWCMIFTSGFPLSFLGDVVQ